MANNNKDLARLAANTTADGQKVSIANVKAPVADSDAANKTYVDSVASVDTDDFIAGANITIDESNGKVRITSTAAGGGGDFNPDTDTILIGLNANAAADDRSIAIGYDANTGVTEGTRVVALGPFATSTGDNSIAVGQAATADTDHSVALGRNARALHAYGIAIGRDALTTEANQLVIGGDTSAESIRNIRTPHFRQGDNDPDGRVISVDTDGNWSLISAGGAHARSVYVEASNGDTSELVYLKHNADGTVNAHTVDSEYAGIGTGQLDAAYLDAGGRLTIEQIGQNQSVPFDTSGEDIYIVTDTYTVIISGSPDNTGNDPANSRTLHEWDTTTIVSGSSTDYRTKYVGNHTLISIHTGKLGFTLADTDWIKDNANDYVAGDGLSLVNDTEFEVDDGYGLNFNSSRELQVDVSQVATHDYVQGVVRNTTRGEIGEKTDEHTLYLAAEEHDQLRFENSANISDNRSFIVNTRGDTVYQGVAARDDDLFVVQQLTGGGTETVLAGSSRNWEAVQYGVYEGNRWDEADAFTYNSQAFQYNGDAPTTIWNTDEGTFSNVTFERNGHNSSSRYEITGRVQLGVVDDLSHVRSHDSFHLVAQSAEFNIELTSGESQITVSSVRLPGVDSDNGVTINPGQYVAVRWAIHIDHFDDTGVSLTDAPYVVWAGTGSDVQRHHAGRADVRTVTYEAYLDAADGQFKYGNNTRSPELVRAVIDTDGYITNDASPFFKVGGSGATSNPAVVTASNSGAIAIGEGATVQSHNDAIALGRNAVVEKFHQMRIAGIREIKVDDDYSVDTDYALTTKAYVDAQVDNDTTYSIGFNNASRDLTLTGSDGSTSVANIPGGGTGSSLMAGYGIDSMKLNNDSEIAVDTDVIADTEWVIANSTRDVSVVVGSNQVQLSRSQDGVTSVDTLIQSGYGIDPDNSGGPLVFNVDTDVIADTEWVNSNTGQSLVSTFTAEELRVQLRNGDGETIGSNQKLVEFSGNISLVGADRVVSADTEVLATRAYVDSHSGGNANLVGGYGITKVNDTEVAVDTDVIADTDWVNQKFISTTDVVFTSGFLPTKSIQFQDGNGSTNDSIFLTDGLGATWTTTGSSNLSFDVDTDVIATRSYVDGQVQIPGDGRLLVGTGMEYSIAAGFNANNTFDNTLSVDTDTIATRSYVDNHSGGIANLVAGTGLTKVNDTEIAVDSSVIPDSDWVTANSAKDIAVTPSNTNVTLSRSQDNTITTSTLVTVGTGLLGSGNAVTGLTLNVDTGVIADTDYVNEKDGVKYVSVNSTGVANVANGNDAIVIGEGGQISTGESVIAIGRNAVSGANNAVVIGVGATTGSANNLDAIAIGRATANGVDAIALGAGATVNHQQGIAIGVNAATDKASQMRVAGITEVLMDTDYAVGSDYVLATKKYVDENGGREYFAGNGLERTGADSDTFAIKMANLGANVNSGLAFHLEDGGVFVDLSDAWSGIQRDTDGLEVNLGFGLEEDFAMNRVAVDSDVMATRAYVDANAGGQYGLNWDATNRELTLVEGGTDTDVVINIESINIGHLDSETLITSGEDFTDTDSAIATTAAIIDYVEGQVGDTNYLSVSSTKADAAATGTDTMAVGPGASASSTSSIAIGDGAQVNSASSIAIGTGTALTDGNSVVVGPNFTTEGTGVTALGWTVGTSLNQQATSIGYNQQINGTDATALGALAIATQNATALGSGSQANQNNSTAIGQGAVCNAATSIALGHDATSVMAQELVIGGGQPSTAITRIHTPGIAAPDTDKTYALTVDDDGVWSVNDVVDSEFVGLNSGQNFAVDTTGEQINVALQNSAGTVIGTAQNLFSLTGNVKLDGADGHLSIDADASFIASDGITIADSDDGSGYNKIKLSVDTSNISFDYLASGLQPGGTSDASAAGSGAIALGYDANASSVSSVAIGQDAEATASNTVALGDDAKSGGANSIALGTNTQTFQTNSVALGNNAQAGSSTSTNHSQIAIGVDSIATGFRSVAIGSGTSGSDATTVGGSNSVAIGRGATVNTSNSVAIGRNAVTNANNQVSFNAPTSESNRATHMVVPIVTNSTRAAGTTGAICFNTSTNTLQIYNGSEWQNIQAN